LRAIGIREWGKIMVNLLNYNNIQIPVMTQHLQIASTLKCFFILGFLSLHTFVFGQASVPKISFQGVLKSASGAPVADGEFTFTFSFWKSLTGTANADKLLKVGQSDPNNAANQWSETVTLGVAGGIYSHNLGSVTPLNPSNFNGPVYLNIKVGGKDLVPRTEFTYSPFSFSVATAQTVACSGAVGDIKYSILSPDKFKDVNGDCWVPLDGRSLNSNDALYALGVTDLPNAGGTFIRAQDFAVVSGSEAWKPKNASDNDPDRTASSTVGTLQADGNKSHNHSGFTATDGAHSHTSQTTHLVDNDDNDDTSCAIATPCGSDASGSTQTSVDISNSGSSHRHAISSDGIAESRPKNLNFWVYVRIN